MLKLVIATVFGLVSTSVLAQEEEVTYYYTRQPCGPVYNMMQDTVIGYDERALFTGTGLSFSIDGTPFQGSSMFFVNQDTGTWTLLTIYGDGTACIAALGIDFEPYVE